jgi:hypothetical protein
MGGDAEKPPFKSIWDRNEPLLEEFESWASDQGLKASTAQRYVGAVRIFVNNFLAQGYSGEERLPEDVTVDTLDSFLGQWYRRRVAGRGESRLRTMIAALKRFYAFLSDTQRMEEAAAGDLLRLLKEDRSVYLDRIKGDLR